MTGDDDESLKRIARHTETATTANRSRRRVSKERERKEENEKRLICSERRSASFDVTVNFPSTFHARLRRWLIVYGATSTAPGKSRAIGLLNCANVSVRANARVRTFSQFSPVCDKTQRRPKSFDASARLAVLGPGLSRVVPTVVGNLRRNEISAVQNRALSSSRGKDRVRDSVLGGERAN